MWGVEVVIGFAFGYWIGTRQGRKGLQDALDSAQAIMASPETRRVLSDTLSVLEGAVGPAMEALGNRKSSRNRAALLGSVVDELIERRQRRAA
jgi:hypothetical protein